MLCVWYQPQQAGHYSPDYKRLMRSNSFGIRRPDEEEEDKELERLLNLAKAQAELKKIIGRQNMVNAERIENLEIARNSPPRKETVFSQVEQEMKEKKRIENEDDVRAKRMYNIVLAQKANEKERERQEEIVRQRLKNLAKARRVKARNK